jgi:hypothetical protein
MTSSSRPRPKDAAEVAALIVELELVQEGEAETTPADIVREWETMDTDQDVWLVRKRGRSAPSTPSSSARSPEHGATSNAPSRIGGCA